MRKLPLLGLAFLFAWSSLVGADDPLRDLRPAHPRLLCTDADLARIEAAAKDDAVLSDLLKRIPKEAERQLAAEALKHRLLGPRLLDQSRTAVQRVLICALAFRLTHDARFATQAKSDLLTAASFADWNPSHFLDVAEMTLAVAVGYDWLYAELSPAERATLKQAILRNALAFAPAAYAGGKPSDPRLSWVEKHSNWNQVCNTGLIAGALALADEEPALARTTIEGARRSLRFAQELYAPDGGYPEGPSYWAYGTSYYVMGIAMLESALGTDLGLTQDPGFARTALFRMQVVSPTGLAFNYADSADELNVSPTLSWLAQRFHHPDALAYSRQLLAARVADRTPTKDRFFPLNALWFPARLAEKPAPAPRDVHFRGPADIALFRGAWDNPRALFVGFKAGTNAANHSHLDLGSFVLDADGVRWAVDLGRDNYNLPDYFGAKRWNYFRLTNHSHNTVTLGDKLQDPKAEAPIVAFESTPARAFAVADLSAVYPGVARQAKRAVTVLEHARVLVDDDLRGLAPETAVRWAMATGATVTFDEAHRVATLTQGKASLRVELLAPQDACFAVTAARPPTKEEEQNEAFRLLVIDYHSRAPDVRLSVALTPTGPNWPQLPPPAVAPLP